MTTNDATPIETADWLVRQFRDRAKDDPGGHTEKDAREVEALRSAFLDMLDALHDLLTRPTDAASRQRARAATAKASIPPAPKPAAEPAGERDEAYIAAAREKWRSDDLEIDDSVAGSNAEPRVSVANEGAWVSAWVWVTNDEAGLPDEEDDEEDSDRLAAYQQGWGIFESGDGQLVIEADSERDVFPDNLTAYAFVEAQAAAGDPVAIRALAKCTASIPAETAGDEED